MREKTLRTLRLFGALAVLALGVSGTAEAATFTVNRDTLEPDAVLGDGACDTNANLPRSQCTLLAALQEANDSPAHDQVEFSLPSNSDRTIDVPFPLPSILHPIAIDGYTQPGSSRNSSARGTNAKPGIALNYTGNGDVPGLMLSEADTSTITGLAIGGFAPGIIVAADEVSILGNFIGTDLSGEKPRDNEKGLVLLGEAIKVGGTAPSSRNLISGNREAGIDLRGVQNSVVNNLIGTGANARTPFGNGTGLSVSGTGHTISDNTIAHNSGLSNLSDGVSVHGDAQEVEIAFNSVFANGDLGIDLGPDGPTPNDPAPDLDEGENGLQNHPELEAATIKRGKTVVKGRLVSAGETAYRILFYSDPARPNRAEGRKFVHQKNFSTSRDGTVEFKVKLDRAVKPGESITATANPAQSGATSEFSPAVRVKG